MAYLGAIAVILGVYMAWRGYVAFLDEELSSIRAFLTAVTDYRDKMKCYMDTPTEWAIDYSDERLLECGFLNLLRDGADFRMAYRESRAAVILTDAADKALSSAFDRLGEGYLDTELEVLGVAIDKLAGEERALSSALGKRRRAAGAVLGAFASGIVILIM